MLHTRVDGCGPTPARIAFFGDRPGYWESKTGVPFSGKTGKEFDRYLWMLHLDRSQIWIDNICRNVAPSKNRQAITAEELLAEEPTILETLNKVRPELVITMGLPATRFFLGDGATMERDHAIPQGIKMDTLKDLYKFEVFPVYNPAAGLHTPDLQPLIMYDFQQLARYLEGVYIPPPIDFWEDKEQYVLCTKPLLDAFCLALHERPLLIPGVDTEGLPGSEWGLSISASQGTGIILKRDVHPAAWFAQLNEALKGHTVALHNSLHDLKILDVLGVHLDKFTDTMIMAYLLQVEPQGLKPLSYRHSGMIMSAYEDVVQPYAQKVYKEYFMKVIGQEWPKPPGRKKPIAKRLLTALTDLEKGKIDDLKDRWDKLDDDVQALVERKCGPFPEAGIHLVPDDVAIPYSARDADATFRLYPALAPRIGALGLDSILDLDLSVVPMIDRMQQVGFTVDVPYLKSLGAYLEGVMAEKAQEAALLTGRDDFNLGSGDQVAEFLFNGLKLEAAKMTKSGARPSVDEKATEELKLRYCDNPLVLHFLDLQGDYIEAQKLKGTYVDNISSAVGPDGRLHYDLRITRVVTGRLAGPILTIPVRSELGRKIRHGFKAPPGRLLGSWDLDQVEVRVLAHLSQDPGLVAVLCDPKRHVHKETTARMYREMMTNQFGVPICPAGDIIQWLSTFVNKDSSEYMMSKNITFGIVYGISKTGLRAQAAQRGLNWTEDDAQKFIDFYLREAYPGVGVFMEDQRAFAAMNGFVKTMIGRMRYLPGIHSPVQSVQSEAIRAAGNYPIQGTASDIIKLWMKEAWKTLKTFRMDEICCLLQVHDELILEFPEGMEDFVNALMREALATAVSGLDLRVPIRCSHKIAQDWGELK